MSIADWATLLLQFVMLSFLAIGGVMAVAPDMHRVLVDERMLLTHDQFLTAVTIGKVSPGPNALMVAVLGYQIAGLSGAIAISLAMVIPSATLAFYALRWTEFNAQRLGVRAFKLGSAPIVVGLLLATGLVLMKNFSSTVETVFVVVIAVIIWRTRVHLMLLMLIGATLGAIGLI